MGSGPWVLLELVPGARGVVEIMLIQPAMKLLKSFACSCTPGGTWLEQNPCLDPCKHVFIVA